MLRPSVFGQKNRIQRRRRRFSKKSGRFASDIIGTMVWAVETHFDHLPYPTRTAVAAEFARVNGGFDGLCWVANLSTSDLRNPV
ncbi:MAG: hypothetical protein DWI00_01800 [Planctomycetota bacterium]|nr:MAG: hypothetical protein DWI00_01800 [Planctomycetota bacterium]